MNKIILSVVLVLTSFIYTSAQESTPANRPARTLPTHQMRLIIDNDFAGDPDGMFQLVHHLLSPSVDIRAIIGSHLRVGDVFDPTNKTADNAKKHIEDILAMMNMTGKYPALAGSNVGLADLETPLRSEAAEAIVREAMRDDTNIPLYVVCGGGLTEIASAYLMEPRIADRLTLVWIGGMEYTDVVLPPPGYARTEYNTAIDIKAVQVVFNKSNIKLWQIPRNVYRQALVTKSELNLKVRPYSEVGAKITDMIERILNMMAREAYILGDNPLVLVTALQSVFEADASSSPYQLRQAPFINDEGMYEINRDGRIIKVFNQIDNRLMFEDMFAKMQLLQKK